MLQIALDMLMNFTSLFPLWVGYDLQKTDFQNGW